MRRKLSQAPVYFALVQARFNPITALDSYVPKIQDELRRQGYPDFQTGMQATFNLNLAAPIDGNAPQVPVMQAIRYMFSNIGKTSGVLLDQSALSFQTTDYDLFDSFAAEFLKALRIVHEIVSLSYTDQVGLRYLDAVYPRDREKLDQYLNAGVLGLHDRLKGTLEHAFSETRTRMDSITLIARAVIHDGPVGFPPDLAPTMGVMQFAERFRTKSGIHAILDTDGAHQRREPFDLDHVVEQLNALHQVVDDAFKATVTKHALETWA